jgi:hypothetical protein
MVLLNRIYKWNLMQFAVPDIFTILSDGELEKDAIMARAQGFCSKENA